MQTRNAYLLLLLTTLFWGGNAVAGKLAIGHISPMLLTAARWAVAFSILLAIGRGNLVRDWPVMRRHLPLILVLGAAGFSAFNLALYCALLYTSVINASIEQAAMPLLIFLANFMLFGLRVTWAQIAGFVISIAGVVLTAAHGDPQRLIALDVNFGDALMLIAVIVYGGYTVALRFKPPIHWHSLMIGLTGAAFVTSVPFAIAEFWYGSGIAPDAGGWAIILYTAIFPSILGQIFYIRGVELIGANRAGLFVNLVPIFGTLLSIVILGEDFRTYHAVALMMVLGGIWLAETGGRHIRKS